MACLLKLPINGSKGVFTFTTQEQRVINNSSNLSKQLIDLKKKYVVGLHFNWHDYHFKPDKKFDFFMANASDLKPINDTPFYLMPMDACNFTPAIYSPSNTEKFWDILIVGNPVFFKRPEVALMTIRKLFDAAGKHRVLYICPIPEHSKAAERTAFYEIREYYDALFTTEEKNWFTLLTTNFNSPFPFDRHTLSVFFKNSKVFLHSASEERRCRIAAYAWCAGLPVIAYPSVASILPDELQCEPGYFKVESDCEYVPKILSALQLANRYDPTDYQKVISEKYMTVKLNERLANLFAELSLPYEGKLMDKNLDIRLGWHHQNISGLSNGLKQPLAEFMQVLQILLNKPMDFLGDVNEAEYPECILAGEYQDTLNGDAKKVLSSSLYLKPYSVWFRGYMALKNRLFRLPDWFKSE